MTVKDDQGDANMAAALSGNQSIVGPNKEQIEAMGGEVDTDLDDFTPSAADRGDSVDPAAEPEEKAEDEDEEDPAKKSAKVEGEEEPEPKDTAEDEAEEDPAKKLDEGEDEEEEEEEEDPKPKKGDEQRIPKSRFDEVNARRKAAEDKLAALESAAKAKDDGKHNKYDFKKAEREYIELALDGKVDAALAKREEIDAAKESEWEAKQSEKADNSVTQREVKNELNRLVAKFESEYSEFNPDHESFSEDLATEAQSFFLGYLENRADLTAGEAFTLAVENVVKIYGLEPVAGAAKKPKEPDKVTRLVDKKDTKKKIEAAKKAPKDPSKAGAGSETAGIEQLDLEQMTDEEFNALPESTLKRMRGDTL